MCWQSPRLERSGEKLVFSPAGLVHHKLLQNNPSGFIFKCRTHDVAQDIKTYIDNPRTFKKAVKKFLSTNSYSLNEYYDNYKNKF
jgi:hypothetical protein